MGEGVSTRWGIIYHPKSGVFRSHKRWEEVRRLLEDKGVEYDFVQSDGPDSVCRLSRMLVQNGYTRIVVMGGDGALNQALNGILSSEVEGVRERVQLAVIPNGRVNDFASFWEFDEDNVGQTVDWLLAGRTHKVDVGYCKWGSNAPVYFLNCVNIGLMASIMEVKYKSRRFWGVSMLSYIRDMIVRVFKRLEYHVDFRMNYQDYSQKVMTICVGNSKGMGFTPNAVPYNGLLDVSVVKDAAFRQFVSGMWMLFTARILNHKSVTPLRTRRPIVFSDLGNAKVSIDGIVRSGVECPLEIGVLPDWIEFVIPAY